jgi:hypothetical protein
MKYDAEKLFVEELDLDSEPLSIEEMGRYLEEYATEDDWDEDFLNEDWDDFDKIDRKVEEFSARIAELEEELLTQGACLAGRKYWNIKYMC